MDSQFGNTNDHYNDKYVDNSNINNQNSDSAYSVDNTMSYPDFGQTLSNNDMKSFTSESYTVETNITSVTYSETYSSEPVSSFNSDEFKQDLQGGFPEQTQENVQMETPNATENPINDFAATTEFTEEYKVEEVTEDIGEIPEITPEEPSIKVIVEEPTEIVPANVPGEDETVVETVEEIETVPLVETETVENENNEVLVTVIEDENTVNMQTDPSTTVDGSDLIAEEAQKHDVNQEDKNVGEQNVNESFETAEGDLVIEESYEKQEAPSVQTTRTEILYDTATPEKPQNVEEVHAEEQTSIEQHTADDNISVPHTETVIINDHQTETYTILETADEYDMVKTDGEGEMLINESFTDLNTSTATFTAEEGYNEDSSVTEEVIILQEVDSSEENIDDPEHSTGQADVATEQTTSSAKQEQQPEVKQPKRKGRKSTFEIPMHVLGHDISKPVEQIVNGRAVPRPRLGVKVPYRNLTSQIVSKQELEKEIIERGRLKMEQNKGDVKFARSLTQRLAKKIAPTTGADSQPTAVVSNVAVEKRAVKTAEEADKKTPKLKTPAGKTSVAKATATSAEQHQQSIQNDSDLLAILEGDEDDPADMQAVVQKDNLTTSPQADESNLRDLEREIALQQLSELPHQTPKHRIFRGKNSVAAASPEKNTATHGSASKERRKDTTASSKANISSTSKKEAHIDLSPRKTPVEVEPQVKVNMVLKTYSRKRKTSEAQDPLKDYPPPPKKPTFEDDTNEIDLKMDTEESSVTAVAPPSPVYVTKSSRVIKKKVIWDPDDDPVRTPTFGRNLTARASPAVKTVKTDKNSNNEKVMVEKKTPVEKKASEKKEKVAQGGEKKGEKTPMKKSISPKSNSGTKPKKARSEIDRLLMDEGAVKMLYELNNSGDGGSGQKKKKDFYSVERAEKEIIKKANLLKNELEQTTATNEKSLRKKEALIVSPAAPSPTRFGPIMERKMSKDSTKSSVHTPPSSPYPHNQSSMLIRRRSSSSLSSDDNERVEDEDDSDSEIEFKPRDSKRKSDTPKAKKSKKSESEREKSESADNSSFSVTSPAPSKKNVKAMVLEVKLNQYKAFTVKKTARQVTVDLNYIDDKCYLTLQVLEELTIVLKKFAKDKDCNVLMITSSNKAYCLGLDYASLVESNEEKRKEKVTELADKVRDFLLCLLHFPKVLIACIQGECRGLGVTMLPLFDMVIASDVATFTTPYINLGCAGEGAFLLSYPSMVNHGLASEMLYTGQQLTADEAFRRGLVSKLCWPEKYKETLKNIIESIAKGSRQSLETIKKHLRCNKTKEIEAAINAEKKVWIEHWSSAECQEKFSELKRAN